MRKYDDGLCKIRRTFKRTHSTLNMRTGESIKSKVEIVTEPCRNPLFGDEEQRRRVCGTCASGWEAPDNRFSSEKQKTRAIAKRTGGSR